MVERGIVLAACLALAGCASFSDDGGFGPVRSLAQEHGGPAPSWQRSTADREAATQRVAELLQAPLSADGAVELSYLNNRGLQSRFAELGIAEAELVQAGRLRNPGIGFGRVAGGGSSEIDRSLVFDVLGLMTLPLATRLAQQQLEQVQLQAAQQAVALAAQVRQAYYQAVAAGQLQAHAEQVMDAAEATRELAQQMQQAGHFSALAQLREQAFHADAAAQLARSRQQTLAMRERLTRLLGLVDPPPLPERLPELPAALAEPQHVEQTAIDQRLDVRLARRQAEATAQSLGATRTTRFINVLEAGYQDKRQTGEPLQRGYELRLELPLFDFGTARVARAEATYQQALDHAAQVAIDARSEVREAHAALRSAHALALHYRDEVVPLRQRISQENLLRYNGMLISVFELLADAREQIAGVTGAVEAQRDFWLAQTALQSALTGAL
jgi:outer membrane protein TolC